VAAVLVCLVAGCGLFREEKASGAPLLPEPPMATRTLTYPAERTNIAESIDGSAVVTPVRETSLYFIQGGRLKKLNVEPQDEVRKGDILAQLEIGALEHQLELAKVDLRIARVKLEELQVLGSVFDIRTQELQIARHEVDISFLSQRIEAATIRAPYDGIIHRVQVTISDEIEEFEPVMEILDPTELELQMKIGENDYYMIEPGLPAKVEVAADDWRPALVVQTTHKNPRFDASIRREEFIVHLELTRLPDSPPPPELRLNQRMNTQVILAMRENALVIPKAGLREFRDRTYVRILDGEVRREVDVKAGIRTDTQVEILEGLSEGDLVIGK
jgi:RND family efflux transporter MFP subunit